MWTQIKELMYHKQEETISTLNGQPRKLIKQFAYFSSKILSIVSDVNICQANRWNAIDKLSIIWKSDHANEIKWNFFQVVSVFVLLHGCTTWMLGVISWLNGSSAGLWNRSMRVRTPVAQVRSLLRKYLWGERYETPYLLSYGLNSTTTVFLEE